MSNGVASNSVAVAVVAKFALHWSVLLAAADTLKLDPELQRVA